MLAAECGTLFTLMKEGEPSLRLCRYYFHAALTPSIYVNRLFPPCACTGRTQLPMAVLALDEAQIIYNVEATNSKAFWTLLKRLQANVSQFNVRVVLAATYSATMVKQWCNNSAGIISGGNSLPGSPAAAPTNIDTATTFISIHPSLDGRDSLQLTPGEVQELWNAWLVVVAREKLDEMVKDQIASYVFLTGGNV